MTTPTNIMYIPRTLGLIMWIIRIVIPFNILFCITHFPNSKISQLILVIYKFFKYL